MKKALLTFCSMFCFCSNPVHPPLAPVGAWQAVEDSGVLIVHSLILLADSIYTYDKIATENQREEGAWSFSGDTVTLKPHNKETYEIMFSGNTMTYKNLSFTRITLNYRGVEHP